MTSFLDPQTALGLSGHPRRVGPLFSNKAPTEITDPPFRGASKLTTTYRNACHSFPQRDDHPESAFSRDLAVMGYPWLRASSFHSI